MCSEEKLLSRENTRFFEWLQLRYGANTNAAVVRAVQRQSGGCEDRSAHRLQKGPRTQAQRPEERIYKEFIGEWQRVYALRDAQP